MRILTWPLKILTWPLKILWKTIQLLQKPIEFSLISLASIRIILSEATQIDATAMITYKINFEFLIIIYIICRKTCTHCTPRPGSLNCRRHQPSALRQLAHAEPAVLRLPRWGAAQQELPPAAWEMIMHIIVWKVKHIKKLSIRPCFCPFSCCWLSWSSQLFAVFFSALRCTLSRSY